MIANKFISGWVRQARYRLKNMGRETDVTVDEVHDVLSAWGWKCGFCDADAVRPELVVSLHDLKALVPATIIPSCASCAMSKGGYDLIWMFNSGKIDESRYLQIVKKLLTFRGKELFREWMKAGTDL